MRVVVQRVTFGSVTVSGQVVGEIAHGLVLLVGIGQDDTEAVVGRMAEKVANLRIFSDEQGRFNHSLLDVAGGALVVSQFTLYGDARKGRRPSFSQAGHPKQAQPLCDRFADKLREQGVTHVATGQFGASMQVRIDNDGPVTIWLDSADWAQGK